MALAQEDSPVYVAGGAVVLASMYFDKDKVAAAMRGNGALSWADHHPCLFSGTERFFRPGYRAHLVSEWLPALDGVVPRLGRGQGRRRRLRSWCVDLDHGEGISEVDLPRIRLSRPLDRPARQRAADAAVGDRVQFTQATHSSFPGGDFDLVCFFDCLHDMGDPVGAPGARRGAEAGGTCCWSSPSPTTISTRI